ncbi:hypothetical protein B0O99DRAFT_498769 [Bisporella sp. PMI_857]|nr:hypothetical protein B0O99DRAFT_498769 [Bisporella sp. PMI_857]
MSQNSQQNDRHYDQLQFFPSDASPTVGRNTTQYPPNNSSSLSETGKRSQRKAAPSPLQTTTSAASPPASVTPTRSTFSRSGVDHPSAYKSSSSPPEQPRSPKEQLDDLLASERSFYRSEDSSVDSVRTEKRYGSPQDSHAASRSVSDPLLISKPSGGLQTSPTSARPPMAATAPQHRVDMGRGPPRTSSIDSAISSISGASQTFKSSHDPSSTSADISNLIQTAGSPEAVIQYLLKEKQSQAAQNAQLWRLVDKQRAMILGLNKDLERALKDKERYRKKLKESLAHVSNPSPVDSTQGISSEVASISSENAVPEAPKVEVLVSASLRDAPQDEPNSPINVALAPYPITPPADFKANISTLGNMVEAEHKMPSPTKHAFQQYDPDAPDNGFEAGQEQRKLAEVVREMPYNVSVPPSRSLPADPPRGPPPKVPPPRAPAQSSMSPPSLSVIEASPNPDENLKAFPAPPPRKAPPAPLNLGKKNEASSHLRQASGAGDDSDSDYDDILEVDEIPTFTERGRRKTREEDDREREAAAMKEAELRSLSKKSAKSKSYTATSKDKKGEAAAVATQLSPRPTVPIAPPDLHMADSNAGSLAGILSASRTVDATNTLSPPLMSPGLPQSPRPIDRGLGSPALPRHPSSNSSLSSPPMSPRGMGGFPGSVPLSPRAPRQPIPLPPGTPMSIASPGLPPRGGEPLHLVSPKHQAVTKLSNNSPSSSPQDDKSPTSFSSTKEGIFKGFVTEEYPDLLLPPNAIPSIDIRVASSRLRPSRASIMFPKDYVDDPVFTLAVFSKADGRELWRVEKDSTSLSQLDQALKQSAIFTAKTPDKSLFSGHAPAKVDARRTALDNYLDEILNTHMDTASALLICKYISTNTMAPNAEEMTPNGETTTDSPTRTGPGGRPLKNGYLTKRGKNFGGWKARFFVLDGPVFKYYESPGGPHLGTIKLQGAQIGKQQQTNNQSPSRGDLDDPDNQYRHAFLILEPKRKDNSSKVKHVLCAESDKERDQWVDALSQYLDYRSTDEEDDAPRASQREHGRKISAGSSQVNGASSKKKASASSRSQTLPEISDDLRGLSYESTKPGSIPIGARGNTSGTPSPPTTGYERDPMSQLPNSQSTKSISAPKNVQPIQDAGSWGNKQNLLAPIGAEDKKQRKRSFFGFGSKPRASTDSQDTGPTNDSQTNLSQMAYEQHGPIRPVFGSPLNEAVRFNHPVDVHIQLPAVVYRCIEYLDANNAANEEGIFRLSGSNLVIKQLRERFNNEGDVDLIGEDAYIDIHAVASLLKLYLRELPTTILTRELHLEFLAVTELHDVHEKISALNTLVHRLPTVNHNLLRYLAGFLISITKNADVNKMTVRNVGIVFSPTLNIPAPVFALFLQQYEGIFGQEPNNHDSAVEINVEAPPLTPEDIRSPRQQRFQNIPTPSYEQQSFPENRAPPSFPQPQYYQQQQRQAYDTGLTPMKPSYEPQLPSRQTLGGPEYGRQTPTLAGPAYEQFGVSGAANRQYGSDQMGKSKRRESSMFGLSTMGHKRPSSNRLRNDSRE